MQAKKKVVEPEPKSSSNTRFYTIEAKHTYKKNENERASCIFTECNFIFHVIIVIHT